MQVATPEPNLVSDPQKPFFGILNWSLKHLDSLTLCLRLSDDAHDREKELIQEGIAQLDRDQNSKSKV